MVVVVLTNFDFARLEMLLLVIRFTNSRNSCDPFQLASLLRTMIVCVVGVGQQGRGARGGGGRDDQMMMMMERKIVMGKTLGGSGSALSARTSYIQLSKHERSRFGGKIAELGGGWMVGMYSR